MPTLLSRLTRVLTDKKYEKRIMCCLCDNSVRVVFKWIMKCFSGYLLPEQLLNLWDMILAYDSLEVLPVLAVAILSFRKENLLQVYTLQNVEVSGRYDGSVKITSAL